MTNDYPGHIMFLQKVNGGIKMSEFDTYEYDPLHAQDYSNPDEFYDDHFEEFDCLDDAEDYFCDHNPDA